MSWTQLHGSEMIHICETLLIFLTYMTHVCETLLISLTYVTHTCGMRLVSRNITSLNVMDTVALQ